MKIEKKKKYLNFIFNPINIKKQVDRYVSAHQWIIMWIIISSTCENHSWLWCITNIQLLVEKSKIGNSSPLVFFFFDEIVTILRSMQSLDQKKKASSPCIMAECTPLQRHVGIHTRELLTFVFMSILPAK